MDELELLQKRYDELEGTYLRFKETSAIDAKNQFNAFIARLGKELNHEFKKLQRGIDKHIQDEKTKSQFEQIMSKIENKITFEDTE